VRVHKLVLRLGRLHGEPVAHGDSVEPEPAPKPQRGRGRRGQVLH
jgi:hypothetical protein